MPTAIIFLVAGLRKKSSLPSERHSGCKPAADRAHAGFNESKSPRQNLNRESESLNKEATLKMAYTFRNPELALCATLLCLPSVAFSQSKVAIMNPQKSVMETAEFRAVSVDMVTRYKARQDRLEQMRKELSKLETQRITTAADQVAMLSQVDSKRRQVEQFEKDLKTDLEHERNEVLQRLRVRMIEVVRRIMDEKGLEGVIESTSAVLFKPGLDITGEATAAYDKMYPVK